MLISKILEKAHVSTAGTETIGATGNPFLPRPIYGNVQMIFAKRIIPWLNFDISPSIEPH